MHTLAQRASDELQHNQQRRHPRPAIGGYYEYKNIEGKL